MMIFWKVQGEENEVPASFRVPTAFTARLRLILIHIFHGEISTRLPVNIRQFNDRSVEESP